jgi:hypothetical protein
MAEGALVGEALGILAVEPLPGAIVRGRLPSPALDLMAGLAGFAGLLAIVTAEAPGHGREAFRPDGLLLPSPGMAALAVGEGMGLVGEDHLPRLVGKVAQGVQPRRRDAGLQFVHGDGGEHAAAEGEEASHRGEKKGA